MKYARMGAAMAVVAVLASACSSTSSSPAASAGAASAGASGGAGGAAIDVKVGIEFPMSGGEAPNGVPSANGVALALSQIQVPGFNITINQQDDAVNGQHNPQQGAKNMQTLVNDPQVLFVVGPYNSNVAAAEIPVGNAAGLAQCSPANTNPGLTKTWPSYDYKALRATNPDKNNYFRTATTDDLQGAAGADIAFNIAKAKTAYVADDVEAYGKGLADVFVTSFQKLGGTVVGRDSIPTSTTDFSSFVTKLKGLNPDYVFYGGVTTSGIGLFRNQMAQAGLQTIPMGGGDGIVDGAASVQSSFLQIAGDGAVNTYGTTAGPHSLASDATPSPTDLAAAYKAKYNTEPGAYTAASYACTQAFLQALKDVGPAAGGDLAKLREAIRAYLADPSHTYQSALGTFSFDAAGDTSQKIISYFQYDASTKDWKFLSQRDFVKNPF
jgi:branched-chain amino acid transport system substrate-binding protein